MEEEEIQPPKFPFNIEEDIFQNFGNTSMYLREKRPPVPKEPIPPPDKASLKEAVKGVIAVMNSDWVREGEMSPEAIRIQNPLYSLPCFIQGTAVSVLYSPTVGANIMSACYALSHLNNNPLLPTSRSLWIGPCSTIEGIGILHNIPVWYEKSRNCPRLPHLRSPRFRCFNQATCREVVPNHLLIRNPRRNSWG